MNQPHPDFPNLAAGPKGRALLALTIVSLCTSFASATPTQEEVFRSINQSVNQAPDFSMVLPVMLAGAGLINLLVLFNHRSQRQAAPKAMNNGGRLVKEVARAIHLKPLDVKRLKAVADAGNISSPLTLLLCPSVLAKLTQEKTEGPQHSTLAVAPHSNAIDG